MALVEVREIHTVPEACSACCDALPDISSTYLCPNARAPHSLPGMVKSMLSLMESDLEDGEDAMVIANEYVHVACLVTSTMDAMSFDAGEAFSFVFRTTKASLQRLMCATNLVRVSVHTSKKRVLFRAKDNADTPGGVAMGPSGGNPG